jgi:hypothetical protein
MSYKNILLNFNANDVYCISSGFVDNNFSFVLPVYLNRSLSHLIDRIQVISQNNDRFNSTFNNSLNTETLDYKKYAESSIHSDMFENNSVIKDVFLNYNQSFNLGENSNLVDHVNFSVGNFVNNEEESVVSINKYEMLLPTTYSRRLLIDDMNNIKLVFLSSSNEVLHESDILRVAFKTVHATRNTPDAQRLYSDLILDNFSNSMSIAYLFNNYGNFVSVSVPIIDAGNSVAMNVHLSTPGKRNVLRLDETNMFLEAEAFLYDIYKDFELSDNENFSIIANINCTIDTGEGSTLNFSFFKEFNYDKTSALYNSLKDLFLSRALSNVLSNLNFDHSYMSSNIDSTFISQQILIDSQSVSSSILDEIVIRSIRKNSVEVENVYLNETNDIESIYSYKNKSLLSYLMKSNVYYIKNYNTKSEFSIELEFMGVRREFTSNSVVSKGTNPISTANSLLKSCISIQPPTFNTNLSNKNSQIFKYSNIKLANLHLLNEIAYDYGYIDSRTNIGDPISFINQAMFMFKNNTAVKTDNVLFLNNTHNLLFGSNVFTDINNNDMHAPGIVSLISTPDLESLEKIPINDSARQNEYVYNFFKTENIENSYNFFSHIDEINIKSTLSIEFIPIPKIIAVCRRLGITNNTLISDTQMKEALLATSYDSIDILRRDLIVKTIEFIQGISTEINGDVYDRFINVWFDSASSNNMSNLYRLFYIFSNNVNADYFKLVTSYNKSDILNLSSFTTNKDYMSQKIITTAPEHDFMSRICDVSYNNKEVNISSLPIKAVFNNTSYVDNEYFVRDIVFINESSDIAIDLSNINDLITISDIVSDTIKVRFSVHLLTLDVSQGQQAINNVNVINNTSYGSKNVLSYNYSYADANFNNIRSCIDSRFISLNTAEEKVYVDVRDVDYFDINRLDYNKFADFLNSSINNNSKKLEKIILRTSLSFRVASQGSDKYITTFFNTDIPYVNLNNQNIRIDLVDSITSVLN